MDEIQERKRKIRLDIAKKLESYSESELEKMVIQVERQLSDFANFVEAKIPLLYIENKNEVPTRGIIDTCIRSDKILVLPVINMNKFKLTLKKIDDMDADLKPGPEGILEPDADRCKTVPVDRVDIAIIPGIAFDEKGGRIGIGNGYYDRLIPKLAATTRKVALAFEAQIIQQVPMQAHDKHVDIIITEKRIIYKI